VTGGIEWIVGRTGIRRRRSEERRLQGLARQLQGSGRRTPRRMTAICPRGPIILRPEVQDMAQVGSPASASVCHF
jgi:hypothetical protein